jgi:hypothetical protein
MLFFLFFLSAAYLMYMLSLFNIKNKIKIKIFTSYNPQKGV